jgi:hypothetical protein
LRCDSLTRPMPVHGDSTQSSVSVASRVMLSRWSAQVSIRSRRCVVPGPLLGIWTYRTTTGSCAVWRHQIEPYKSARLSGTSPTPALADERCRSSAAWAEQEPSSGGASGQPFQEESPRWTSSPWGDGATRPSDTSVMSRDIPDSPDPRWVRALFVSGCLGLVGAGGVEGEVAQDFAGGGVDDADVEVVDEHDDGGSGVGSSDADFVEVAVVAEGDFAGGVLCGVVCRRRDRGSNAASPSLR